MVYDAIPHKKDNNFLDNLPFSIPSTKVASQ